MLVAFHLVNRTQVIINLKKIHISIFVVNFACVISEKAVYTFGLGQYGQLGHGTFVFESSVPKPVKRLKRHKICNIACGENHSAVIAGMGVQNSGTTSRTLYYTVKAFLVQWAVVDLSITGSKGEMSQWKRWIQ